MGRRQRQQLKAVPEGSAVSTSGKAAGVNTDNKSSNVKGGTIVSNCSTGGTLKLAGSNVVSSLDYYFYDGTDYLFKVEDIGLANSSITLNPLNATLQENLIAVYNIINSLENYTQILFI